MGFLYRPRREDGGFEPAAAGTAIRLQEQVEYVLQFPGGCPAPIAQRLAELGGELVAPDLGILSFKNFVGRTELCGVPIEVASKKIGEAGVSYLLQEVSELASSLIFGWRSPVAFAATQTTKHHSPVPYHQLQFLRRLMLLAPPGERMQDWLATIERSPTRRFEPDRPVVALGRVRRLDPRAIHSVFSRIDRLAPLPAGSPLASNPLGQALTFGSPSRAHFPQAVAAPRGRLSYDTPENRFVKHVVGECAALVYRFADHPKLHLSLRSDCRAMAALLEPFVSAPFLDEPGRISGFAAPSQALVKADGYREIYGFWSAFSRHVSLPLGQDETTRLLEGRDIASLYEYWVFMKVLEATTLATGAGLKVPPQIRRDELGESLVLGLTATAGTDIWVRYNPTYRRTGGGAYSTPLRPDVVLECSGIRHGFDAKYRLERFDVSDADADDGSVTTYKRADLYKMHTYRDAIAGMRAAFVVYPGDEFVFFQRDGLKLASADLLTEPDGVGAIPLRPADENPGETLKTVVGRLF